MSNSDTGDTSMTNGFNRDAPNKPEPLTPPTQSESELEETIDFLFKEWRRGAITDVLLQWNIKQRVAQRERAARIDELKQTICHKDGGWENCRSLKARVAELTKGDK